MPRNRCLAHHRTVHVRHTQVSTSASPRTEPSLPGTATARPGHLDGLIGGPAQPPARRSAPHPPSPTGAYGEWPPGVPDGHSWCLSPVVAPDGGATGGHLRLRISSAAWGTTLNRSPTTPKSASSKIGASASLFTATIVFEVCMPARCWMAPEMPSAM